VRKKIEEHTLFSLTNPLRPPMTPQPTGRQNRRTDSDDNAVVLYHPIKEQDSAPDAINAIWDMLETAYSDHDNPKITIAIDINGHYEDGLLNHEFRVFITEFLLPVGSTVANELLVNGEEIDSSENGLEALDMKCENTEYADNMFREDATPQEVISLSTPIAQYNGQLKYALIFKDRYDDLKEEYSDTELLDMATTPA